MAAVCSVNDVRNKKYTLPKDKLLDKRNGSGSGAGYAVDNEGFMKIPEGEAEELPFD